MSNDFNIKFDKKLINRKFRFLLNKKYDRPLTILKGGSSSAKSYSISQLVPHWILGGQNILIARESGNTLRRSIFSGIVKAIQRQKLQKYFTIRYTQLTIASKVSQGCAMFVATSDEEKLKSIEPIQAEAFDMVIMEEASEISFASQNQLRLRMRGATNFDMKRTFMLLNPISRNHVIYKKFYEPLDDPDNVGYIDDKIHLHHSTYKDNPYLEESEKQILLDMAEISPRHYEVYAKGMWGTMTKTVYTNWRTADIAFEDIAHHTIRIGVDWGYIHPTTATFCAYDEVDRKIYIFDEIRLIEESIERLADDIQEKIDQYGIYGTPVYCDTSEPRNRAVLNSAGLNAKKAYKSVLEGIDWMRGNEFIVDKRRCFYTAAELSNYSWKEVNGEVIDEVIKENDDMLDSARYAHTEWTQQSTGVSWGSKSNLFN